MIILGVDPGKMTGLAGFDLGRELWNGSWERDTASAYAFLTEWATMGPELLIACERFVITAGTMKVGRGDENWSLELIGVARYLAARHGCAFELQSAGDAKRFAPDARLKQVGWWNPGHDHANDAARHVLLAVARHEPKILEKLVDV